MVRNKRVHELAKDLGMDTRVLLARLKELGLPEKKTQSTLTEQEIALVHLDTAQPEAQPVVGQERLVAERVVTEVDQISDHVITAREEVRESRLSSTTIRRRSTRTVLHDEEAPAVESSQEGQESPLAVESVPEPFSSPPALFFDLSPVESAFAVPELPSEVSLPETSGFAPAPEPQRVESFSRGVSQEAESVPTPVLEEPPPRIVVEVRQEVHSIPVETEAPSIKPAVPVILKREPLPPVTEKVEVSVPLPVQSASVAVVKSPPLVRPPLEQKPTPSSSLSPSLLSDAPARPRILGRIDLRKLREASEPRPRPPEVRVRPQTPPPASAAPTAAPAVRPPTVEAVGDAASIANKQRPKKRRVIQKPEVSEPQEREVKLARSGGANKRRRMQLPGKEQRQTEITTPRASKRVIRISEVVTVGDLARQIGVKAGEVIKRLMGLGVMATINQVLDAETAALVAGDFDYTVENVAFDVEAALEVGHEVEEGEGKLESRPPVVTIMGHVDHGKTSLLDAVRNTNVTAREHGGITQHIGAYSVQVDGRSVTFLDTPGHEAFTSMRARGAKVTDLVILVVAAEDGVMPQTVEAINHARAAGVPVIVAVNKMDKPGADLERVKRELMIHGLVSEEYGGETIFAPVSAKTNEGIPHLLEMILLQADVMELRAHPDKLARGSVVEAKLDRGRGPVATVLVQEGVLKVGDAFVCGKEYGRIRAMVDSWGERVDKATPSTPVEILGLAGVPEAGDSFVVLPDEAKARQVAEHRRTKRRETELTKSSSRTTLEDFYQQAQAGEVKELRVIIKADVQGSAEAVSDSLTRLSNNEVKLTVLHSSVGGISESDVLLATASKGIIIGFNVRPEGKAAQLAEREAVEVRLYNIIYEVIEDVRAALEGMLEPTYKEKPLGRAEVRQVFTVSRLGLVAGCLVVEGKVVRGAHARLVRNRAVVHTGRLSSLRRFKDDVREVISGTECGISFENFHDVQPGDIIEAYELEQVLRRLESRPQPEAARRAS
ncbi:MAG: translation initiation factor IF-2 [Deltaproteobacteria bacterium]|nr:translation initiation factor IF-2 [Deltaproteobacteria bacterium]